MEEHPADAGGARRGSWWCQLRRQAERTIAAVVSATAKIRPRSASAGALGEGRRIRVVVAARRRGRRALVPETNEGREIETQSGMQDDACSRRSTAVEARPARSLGE